ncbi:MAG: class I SAM-dependent methyltransferase [Candidatus Omnitrophica bacterium]|nr:class I SAM-dependent methyltransferase [Candidatus Omnitrophota bacterium]MDD5671480.1 class I SAM-dependent methyltransferase [Candidatus Omnitrophota bacterium]
MSEPKCNEGEAWYRIYASPELVKRRRIEHARKLEQMGLLSASRDVKILDVCCGQGEMLDLLAEKGFRFLTGVDRMPEDRLVTTSKERGWEYLSAAVPALPFEKETFDWIVCAHALHHLGRVDAIRELLSNIFKCLKPGGQVRIIDHYDSVQLRLAFSILRSPLASVSAWGKSFRKQLLDEDTYLYDYLRHWPQVRQALEQSSFSVKSIRYGLFFFYFLAKK